MLFPISVSVVTGVIATCLSFHIIYFVKIMLKFNYSNKQRNTLTLNIHLVLSGMVYGVYYTKRTLTLR